MKVAMFGTFDIANFGDILFPLVAEKMLRDRVSDLELRRYSYRAKSAAGWHYDVRAIGELERDLPETDLVLIGGGHLIHSNRYMAPDYGPTETHIPHPYGFWWLPAVAGRMAGVPVALHAISVGDSWPRWAEPLYRSFAEALDYANARDRQSLERLHDLGAPDPMLVPDSIFTIDRLVRRGEHSAEYRRFLADHGLTHPYVIVQPSGTLRQETGVITDLLRQAQARGWAVLELPIFQEKLNRTGHWTHIPGIVSARYDPDPLLLAEIIANAQGTIGVSLHLSIVSAVYGVPVYRKRYSDDSKFVLLNDIATGFQFLDDNPRLVDEAGRPDPAIARFQAALDVHYDRLIAMANAPRREPVRARGFKALAALPDALRSNQSWNERVTDELLRMRRARNFASASVRGSLRNLLSFERH